MGDVQGCNQTKSNLSENKATTKQQQQHEAGIPPSTHPAVKSSHLPSKRKEQVIAFRTSQMYDDILFVETNCQQETVHAAHAEYKEN